MFVYRILVSLVSALALSHKLFSILSRISIIIILNGFTEQLHSEYKKNTSKSLSANMCQRKVAGLKYLLVVGSIHYIYMNPYEQHFSPLPHPFSTTVYYYFLD